MPGETGRLQLLDVATGMESTFARTDNCVSE